MRLKPFERKQLQPRLAKSDVGLCSEATVPRAIATASILLAEDLELNQALTSTILKKAGHQVDLVPNGVEAVAAVKALRYDMVLMDIQMPIMDGITATRAIRALGSLVGRVPIIAITANVLPPQVRRFKEAGMNDHIGKPVKANDLLSKINKWLPLGRGANDANVGSPSSVRSIFDQRAFDDLHDLLGEQITMWLSKLNEQLDATFADANSGIVDYEELGRSAHIIVSQAGTLGFFELAEVCRDLEKACTTRQDLAIAFGKARRAAQIAREMLTGLAKPSAKWRQRCDGGPKV